MAIQVGGTSVITDGYQLANITSLDSTTTSTIGAAAGGGFWTKISETNVTSSVSQVEISLPTGYDVFKLVIKDPFFNRATGTYVKGQAYVSTDNGSTYSTQYYRRDDASRTHITWYENFKPDASYQTTTNLHAYFEFQLKMNDSNGPFIMTAMHPSWKTPWYKATEIGYILNTSEEYGHYWIGSFTTRVNKIKFDADSTNSINQGDFILYGATDIG